ncbi:SDR family oxidoreductase [Methanosarcina horonobensis]|uniref:SDR family oxidoreductase n=1 Tax=Methanosarcina horonobensis TaxID=418008 RepID=UPI0022B8776A|nr:SDR family oxidoreductase [Methanosarcina horonobensis]
MISEAVNAFGRIDILVNNAGVAYRKYMVDTSREEYEKNNGHKCERHVFFARNMLFLTYLREEKAG